MKNKFELRDGNGLIKAFFSEDVAVRLVQISQGRGAGEWKTCEVQTSKGKGKVRTFKFMSDMKMCAGAGVEIALLAGDRLDSPVSV
jgi:hypothetical protein